MDRIQACIWHYIASRDGESRENKNAGSTLRRSLRWSRYSLISVRLFSVWLLFKSIVVSGVVPLERDQSMVLKTLPASVLSKEAAEWNAVPQSCCVARISESSPVVDLLSDGVLVLTFNWEGAVDTRLLSFSFEYSGSNVSAKTRLEVGFGTENTVTNRPASFSGQELNYPYWYPVSIPVTADSDDNELVVMINYCTEGTSPGNVTIRNFKIIQQNSNDPEFKKYTWNDYPKEYVPPLTDELIDYVSKRPPATAEVVSGADGVPQLLVNGKAAVLSTMRGRTAFPRDSLQIGTFKQIGTDIDFLDYNVGSYNPERGWKGPWNLNSLPFRTGPNEYNPDSLDVSLWRMLRVDPDANIVIYVHLDDYPEWPEEHPDQVVRNEQGNAVLANSHVVGIDIGQENKDRRIRKPWSFFSEDFKEYCAESLRAVIHHIEQSIPGRSVVGYYLGGGIDNQLYMWEFPKRDKDARLWADYSAPAKEAFRKWAKIKYGTLDTVNRAWKTSYDDFSEIEPPSSEKMTGDKDLFYDPVTEQQMVDFAAFMNEGRARFVEYLAKVCKETSNRPIIVGASAGALIGARSDNNANRFLLQSPWLDYLCSQATYEQRFPPNIGGFNALLASYPINGKIFLADNDQPTFLSPSYHHSSAGYRDGMTMDDVRSMWRRELGRLWTQNGSSHYHLLGYPWLYEDPQIKQELKTLLRKESELAGVWHENSTNELAVIYQEEAKNYCNTYHLSYLWTRVMWGELNASGAVYRDYELHDLLNGKVPSHRAYLFVNLVKIDQEVAAKLKELQCNGNTLIFMQGVGYDSSDKLRQEVTGLDILPLDYKSGTSVNKSEHPILKGIDNRGAPIKGEFKTWNKLRDLLPGYLLHPIGRSAMEVIPNSGTDAVCSYLGSCNIAVAAKDHGDWSSCFIGSYCLTRQMINNLARWSDCWVPAPAGNVVAANKKVFMIHPLKSDEVTLDLNRPVTLKEVEPGTVFSDSMNQFHTFSLIAGHSYLFEVGGAAQNEDGGVK